MDKVIEAVRRLGVRGEHLSVAESCTGGGVSRELTGIPGVSAVYAGGVVAYDEEIKKRVLHVDPEIIGRCGVVSPETALSMALGVSRLMGAEWGLSTTGYAGPGGGDERFGVGAVCFGIVNAKRGIYVSWHARFCGERVQVMNEAVRHILERWSGFALDEEK